MGNQIPETHKQSLSNSSENEIKPIIESIVTDLVNAVHIKESIMSDPTNGDSMDLDKSSYFEANDTLSTPYESPNVEKIILKSGDPLLANDGNTSLNFMELTQLSDSFNKENEYSPKRPSPSTALSDWKYSTSNRSNDDYSDPYMSVGSKYSTSSRSNDDYSDPYKSVGSKYSRSSGSNDDYSDPYKSVGTNYKDILNSWSSMKDEIKDDYKMRSIPSRTSLIRNFDPLYKKDESFNSPSPPERRKFKSRADRYLNQDLNDSTGLINSFTRFQIKEESPEKSSEAVINTTLCNTKPDVLPNSEEKTQKDNELKELKERIVQLEDEVKEKDLKLEEMGLKLDQLSSQNENVLQLINTLHDINQELVECSSNKLDSLQSELSIAVNQRNEIQKNYLDLKSICDKLKNDLSSNQLFRKESENQYSIAIERIKQLEYECNQMKAKNSSLEMQIKSNEGKKEFENEIITSKVQNKRMEMKIKSLENQLEQKNKENTELSSMVDDLINKVHN